MNQPRDSRHDDFEEEFGAVLRRTGEGFTADGRGELADGGLRRGRRLLVRRRLAVTGGVLALAAVCAGGVYGGSLLGPAGGTATATVAAPPVTPAAGASQDRDPAEARIPVKDIAAVLQARTPPGTWRIENPDGTGQSAGGVYDDGRGEAAVTVGLYRAAGSGEAGEGRVACPDKVFTPYDRCATERLPGGGRLMILQGYEYPDRREDTKNWRAVLLTGDGFLVDVSEYNAPAQKGSPVSRPNPPFTPAQLKALVTADAWRPLLAKLPALPRRKPAPDEHREPAGPDAAATRAILRSLLPRDVRVKDQGGQDGYAYVVVDDGRGRSFVQINVQSHMEDVAGHLSADGDVTTLPDGRMVGVTRGAGEKGGAGVVQWTVDTLTPGGFRVVVSAFNAGAQHEAATRAEPALSVKELKAVALSPKWLKYAK
ncbi:hypothetical protein [Streptomyces sp. NPDC001744]|uniref:hypothetical protein n=1 Tax=Streptomyces sp. NPDC001744 TaxID=3364606 RepID=UPI0036B89CEA